MRLKSFIFSIEGLLRENKMFWVSSVCTVHSSNHILFSYLCNVRNIKTRGHPKEGFWTQAKFKIYSLLRCEKYTIQYTLYEEKYTIQYTLYEEKYTIQYTLYEEKYTIQ